MNVKAKYIIVFLCLLMLSIIGNVIQFMDNHNTNENVIFKTDTLRYIDTISVIKPEPYKVVETNTKIEKLPIYISSDTVLLRDSIAVELAYDTKEYKEDSLYHLQITGHNANLDWIKVFPKTTIITNETTITKNKRNRFNVTVGVGGGYGIFSKKPDIFVGGVVGYSF